MFEELRGRSAGWLSQKKHRSYAVLAPFLPETKEFLFEVRSQNLNRQPGEICFPGGRIEAGEQPSVAAVRETREELLVDQEMIEIIAPLDIYIAPYDLVVYPYLGILNDYDGNFQKEEVQEVFTVPFDYFLNHQPEIYNNQITITPAFDFPYHLLGRETYPWKKSICPVLFYQYHDKVIWGMTAQFVYNIVTLYRAS